ncbi:tripartite tricarboxylate transporter substrate binding protein [Bradyrhizobium sp. LHD-71]|uniref:Bug family tripartite tricarboxylate transporter substrate binding protein n=1 Tax=Bradyrhizobium sp. LHD-71 TaxID=3072141 RepID=UPI00281099C6|nr:tripartite tricarboxylate transporter substrate binding protein [Bradyrhizobium sp. LHD-71]MDQ8730454.1 tripartite tricarboxylate transporter substrate binding protein [Bradyrhizobium sp. LHD-71]
MRVRAFATAVIAAASLCCAAAAQADDFPNDKIRILVPTAPAGVADSLSRIVAAKVQENIGQTLYVENRSGANGNIGAQAALTAPADGYTVLMGHIGLMTINHHLYPKMGFSPIKAFMPVVHVVSYPDVLIVNNDLPVTTLKEFIDYAKADPKALTYSSSGYGSSFHMAMELLKHRAGIEAVHVPFAGTAPALNALMAGTVNAAFTDVMTGGPFIAAKKVRALAVSSAHRFRGLPEVPTVAEAGLSGFVVEGWAGLVAANGTPPQRVKFLNEQVNKALKDPTVIEKVSALGGDIVGGTPEQFGEFMASEDKKWGDLVEQAHLRKSGE